MDKSNLFMIYKNLNKRIQILYSRRLILSLLKLFLKIEDPKELDSFFDTISKEDLYIIIKLLVHEGFFINSIEFGSEILISIKKLLIKLNSLKSQKSKEIISYFIEKCLEEIKYVNELSSFSFKTNFTNEAEITEKPYLFFNVWIIMIFSDLKENSELNDIHKNCISIINLLSELITKIKENKEFRWFTMDVLIFYCQNILSILNSNNKGIILDKMKEENILKFELIPNILKLQLFLKELLLIENMDNISKRTQMISEILISIASIDKKIKQIREEEINNNENKKEKENIAEINEDKNVNNKFLLQKLDKNSIKYEEIYGEKKQGELQNIIYDFLLTSNIMKNFFKMDYVQYLAWKEMNPEKSLEKITTFESKHLYSKTPVTYLLEKPNVSTYEIQIDPLTYFDEGDMLIFSSDKNCKNILKCCLGPEENKFSIKSPFIYVTFPCSYVSKLYAFGINNFGKLGIPSNIKEITTPKLLTQLADNDIIDIKIGENCCFILDKNGEIYTAGYGNPVENNETNEKFKVPERYRKDYLIQNEKVNFIDMTNQSVLLNTKDGYLWTIGLTPQLFPTMSFSGLPNKEQIYQSNKFKIKSEITSMSSNINNTFFTTSDGKLYFFVSNDRFLSRQSFDSISSQVPKEISFKKSDFYIMASAGDYFSAFIVKNKITGKKHLFTTGFSKEGRSEIKKILIGNLYMYPQVKQLELLFLKMENYILGDLMLKENVVMEIMI